MTRFKKGVSASPLTQFQPGISASPETQFQKGQLPHNRVPIGTVRIRIETNTGSARAWVKTKTGWRKRAVVEWEKAHHRRVPKGKIIHHRDRNTVNDSPRNLVALTRKQHTNEHRIELLAAMAAELGMRLIRIKKP
jgi:hypothetical protein